MHQDKIHIFIDRTKFDVPKPLMTGTELRALPSPPIGPDRDLFLDVPGSGDDRKIQDAEQVELKNGMHFYTAPSTINPGDEGPELPEEDGRFLREKGLDWELIPTPEGACLVLRDVTVAETRYDRNKTDVMIRIPVGYPMANLDMFYVDPPLRTKSGAYPASAEQLESHGGRTWQRFSRHLPTPWRPGQDGVWTLLALALPELQGAR